MEVSFEKRTEVVPTPVEGVVIECETTVCPGPIGMVGINGHAGAVGPIGNVGGIGCAGAPHPQNVLVPAVRHEQGPLAPVSDLIGDSFPSFDQIILPRINMVQGSGKLKDVFPFGALVFNQNTLLFALPTGEKVNQPAHPGLPPVTITVLHVRPTRFAEKVPWPQKGRICNSEAEVQALGGTISWQEHQMKQKSGMVLFEYMTDTVVAIEKPDHLADDDSVFAIPWMGRNIRSDCGTSKQRRMWPRASARFLRSAYGRLYQGLPDAQF